MDNGKLHLLVVEDDEDDFILLRHLLLKALREVAVERACSGRDALAAVQRSSYDASFFDYRLGAESGLDLLQRFRENGIDVPVIFLTGQGDEEVAVQAMKAGAVDYLLKSKLSEASLTQAVRYALNLHRKEMLVRQAQQELHGSEERFRALVEHSHDLTELLDAQGVTTWASQSWRQIMGFPPEELRGKNGWDLVHPEDRPAVKAAFAWGLQNPGRLRRIELRSRHQDGSWRWLEAVGVNRLQDPAVKAVVVNYRDVTDRRKAEDALQRTSEALRAVFQASPLALLVLLPNGHVAQWNLAAERIFGWSEQEAVGHFNPVVRDCDREAYLAHLRDTLNGNTTLDNQAVARRRDGTEIEVSISTAPLQGGGSEARGAVALIADITEQKRAEREREHLLWNLGERIKEQTCLYSITRLAQQSASEEEIFGHVVTELPKGMQRPELARARIRFQGKEYGESAPASRAGEKLSAPLIVNGAECGLLEVFYPEGAGISFLDEERALVDVIARSIGGAVQRKQAEQRLRLSDEILRRVCALVLVCDQRGQVTYVSPAAEAILGYTPEELLGNGYWELSRGSSSEAAAERDYMARCARGEVPVREPPYEKQLRHRSGTPRWILWSDARDPAGLIIRVGHDITERKRAEEAVHESERRYRNLIETAEEGVWVLDAADKTNFVNAKMAAMLGYTPEEMQGRLLWDFVDPAVAAGARQELPEQREARRGQHESRYLCRDGSYRSVLVNSSPLLDNDGRYTGVLGLITDITERKRSEEALRRSRDEWEITFNSMSEAVSFHDPNFHVLRSNQAFRQLTAGRQGVTCSQLVHGADAPPPACPMTRLQQTKQTETSEFFEPTIGRMLSVRTDPVLNSAGELTSVVHVIHDITERRTLQEQLQQAQKMEAVGQLAGGIAHDFNNLLMVITSYAELMLDGVGDNAALRRDTEEILKAGRRAAALTQQLLAFSRKQVRDPRVLDLNATLAEINKLMPRLVGEDISVEFIPAPALWPVKADPVQIEQVVMNLAANARDAMPQGGRLVLETSNICLDEEYARRHISASAGEYVLLTVSDTGAGIDPAVREHIFEPFFTTKGNGKGTGLGLSSVYGIVKQSGGYIWVYSEVGHGSTFKIYLPRATGAYEPLPGTGRFEGNVGGSETILLVEDEDAVRQATHEFLERNGYTVLQAHCGTEAIAIAERYQGQIDLLVTDVVMPGMSGRELAARLLAARPQLKVLYVSGYTERVLQHGVADSGCTFLQKPFSLNALGCKVRELVEPMAGAPSGQGG